MKIIFVGVFYYEGPVRHLYRIFEIYKALAKIFQAVGIEVKYFSKQNELLPLQDTLTEEAFKKELPECDLLFMWNGELGKEMEIAEKCRRQGTPVYFMELGWLPQCGTFYFDRKGVNYNSTLKDWQYGAINEGQELILRAMLSYYHNFLARKTIGTLEEIEKDYAFVPFQVENDTQIINHSHRFKKMQELVDYVFAYVPAQNKIIFKTHPKDTNLGEIKLPARCKLYNCGTTHDFLPRCKYVITINSTVGIEALTYYKPVINLGDAFYEGRKMTYKVDSDEDIKNAVKWAEEGKASVEIIDAFLYYLFERQWYSADLNNAQKILGLIEGLTEAEK